MSELAGAVGLLSSFEVTAEVFDRLCSLALVWLLCFELVTDGFAAALLELLATLLVELEALLDELFELLDDFLLELDETVLLVEC